MGYKFNPFTGNFDESGTTSVPDPLIINDLTVNNILTANHIHGGIAGSLYVHVKNTSGTTIAKGTPVYAVGAVGDTTTLEVAAADSANSAKSPAIGVLDSELIQNASGHAVMFGEITGLNTGSYAINDELYVAAGGGLTATKPTTGYVQAIAIVGRVHSNTGTLLIKIGSQMDDAAGSDGQIQFNDGGNLGGDADLTYNKTTNLLTTKGDINLDDGGSFTTTLQTITPTANRTLSLPDATGTVALVAGSSGQLLWNNAGANAGASTLTYDGSILTTSGRFINSYNATASSPAEAFTGTWFTGGTSTTTKPHVLIEPTGTTSTAWSTSGTGLGVNAASGFAGNLLDLQLNGTSQFSVTRTGSVTGVTIYATGASTGFVGNRLYLDAANQDVVLNRDAANTLAQRNGTSAQVFRVYNTYTSSTNYELGKLEWTSNVFRIGTEKGSGGGTARALELQTDGTTRLTVAANGATISAASGTALAADHRLTGTAPASATATGTAGDIRYDADYIYICTATNTWKRAALSTW